MSAAFPDRETLATCERFGLWLRQGGGLNVRGRPLPSGSTTGLDFEGYRPYAPGLDPRHVDWAVCARTRELHVRDFEYEGAGRLARLLDASGAMGVGGKWSLVRRLAAVVAYATLREVHQLIVAVVQDGELRTMTAQGGLSLAPTVFRFLAEVVPSGPTTLEALCDLPSGQARGSALLISDFLDPTGGAAGLEAVQRRGFRLDLCRVVAPSEFELPPQGSAVHDPEGQGHRLVDGASRAAFERALEAHQAATRAMARRMGASLLELRSDEPLPQAVDLLQGALLGARRR